MYFRGNTAAYGGYLLASYIIIVPLHYTITEGNFWQNCAEDSQKRCNESNRLPLFGTVVGFEANIGTSSFPWRSGPAAHP